MFKKYFFFIGLLLIGGGLLACGATDTTSSTGTAIQPSQATSAPTTTKHFKIGQTVVIGKWQVKVDGATTNKGDGQFYVPKQGQYVDVTVEVTNKDTTSQEASSVLQWVFRDANGKTFTAFPDSANNTAPDGTVNAGEKLQGVLSYDIPTKAEVYTLYFKPDGFGTDQATFDIPVK